jgi:hypothetical protein
MLATMRSAPLVVLCPTRHGARLHAAGRAVCSLQPACCTLSCSTHVTDQRQVLKAEAVLLVFCCTTHCCTALHSCIVVRRFGTSSLGTVRRRRPRPRPTGATSCVNAASMRAASSPPPRGARCAPVCAGTARSARQQGPPWTARACTGTEQVARDIQCRKEHSGAARGRQTTTRCMDAMPGVVLQYSLSGMDGIEQTVSTVNRNGAGFCAAADAEPRRIA